MFPYPVQRTDFRLQWSCPRINRQSSLYWNFGTSVVTLLRKNICASGDPELTSNHLSDVK